MTNSSRVVHVYVNVLLYLLIEIHKTQQLLVDLSNLIRDLCITVPLLI